MPSLAYRTGEEIPLLPGAVPNTIRPPEVVMHELHEGKVGSTWSKAADVWAVGCTVGNSACAFQGTVANSYMQLYHIKSGNEFISTWQSPNDYLLRAAQFGGPPPKAWLEFWNIYDGHHEDCSFRLISLITPTRKRYADTFQHHSPLTGLGPGRCARRTATDPDYPMTRRERLFLTWLKR